jgi:hypothetical protein
MKMKTLTPIPLGFWPEDSAAERAKLSWAKYGALVLAPAGAGVGAWRGSKRGRALKGAGVGALVGIGVWGLGLGLIFATIK